MIVRILSNGKSFKGLSAYLTHDPDAKTQDRVAWTHTLNCANDHIPSAVDEMLWTARHAELLKQEAGIRAGGRETENPVKHFSLNWAPDQSPTREHMIETTEDFLRHMGWHEHQAALVAHDDKRHAHVHVMLNVVHPETGLRLDDNFEYRRAQKWALEYERENERIYCDERLKAPEEREPSPTRPAWTAFEKRQLEFERAEKGLEAQAPIFLGDGEKPDPDLMTAEWKLLKEIQRGERKEFFADGKTAFSELRKSIYREVRAQFADRWFDYDDMRRSGVEKEQLAEFKAQLLIDQNAILEERRDEACKELLESRKALYEKLLENQQLARHELHDRQNEGLDSTVLLELERERHSLPPERSVGDGFRAAAAEVTSAREDKGIVENPDASPAKVWTERENPGFRSAENVGADLAEGIGFGIISLLESIADGIMGAKPAPKPRQAEPDRAEPNPFDAIIEQGRERQRNEQEEADREWRKKQRSYGE
jgi:hypothetical protein